MKDVKELDTKNLEEVFDFALEFSNWRACRHQQATAVFELLAGVADGVIYADSRGIVSATCGGHGFRVDYPIQKENGFFECVQLNSSLLLIMHSIRPKEKFVQRVAADDSSYLGVQFRQAEEISPLIHASDTDVAYIGRYMEHSTETSDRVFHAGESYLLVALILGDNCTELLPAIHIPAILETLEEATEETSEDQPFFVHYKSDRHTTRCAKEILGSKRLGVGRLDYMKIKSAELLLYLEQLCLSGGKKALESTLSISRAEQEAVYTLFTMINEKPGEHWTLSVLANKANISENRFNLLFKHYFDYPAHQYIVQRRMEYAGELLRNPSLTVSSVAHKVGYSDRSGFARAFVKHFGMTPRKYKVQ